MKKGKREDWEEQHRNTLMIIVKKLNVLKRIIDVDE